MKKDNVYPCGWLRYEMKRDLEGFLGNLDNAVPDIIKNDDIYGVNRLSKKVKSKDVGAIAQDADWEVQYLWWNSESFSNWLDGLIRTAYVLEDEVYLEKAKKYLFHVLDSQDDNGYIGIYDEDLRYHFSSENGELWAQATFLRSALSYYKLSKDKTVLQKVIKAVQLTMNSYPREESEPFKLDDNYAGACHGLMFVDVCFSLYMITNEHNYLSYAGWLYLSYSKEELSEYDIQECQLRDFDQLFYGHAPHTYEHFRALLIAHEAGYYHDSTLIQSYLQKLKTCISPSGGPIGDEWVYQRTANPTSTGYEYCSLQELLHSYHLMYQLSKEVKYLEKMEWMFYNAAMGARHPFRSQIAYCQRDNAYQSTGDQLEGRAGQNIRYKYSVAHQDVAVCCVPNAGRIMSYFLDAVYECKDDVILINLYTPSTVKKVINNQEIVITQETDYPFNLSSKIKVSTNQEFQLMLRKPSYVEAMNVSINGVEITNQDKDYWLVHIYTESIIEVVFEAKIVEHKDLLNDSYFSYGPLIYAVSIEEVLEEKRVYPVGEADALYRSKNQEYKDWIISTSELEIEQIGYSFQNPTTLIGTVLHKGKQVKMQFKPMGSTILRKVTFKKSDE